MNFRDIADKLNYQVEYISKESEKPLHFYNGKLNKDVCLFIKSLAPHAKVAVMGLKENYDEKVKPISDALLKNKNKPYSLLLPKKADNIELLSKMFALPEDVRFVIAVDCEIYNVAFYFASVRKAQVILACDSLEFFYNFYFHTLVRSGNALDYVFTPCVCHVFLDDKLLSFPKAEFYALAVGKIPAVFDYEIARRINGSKIDSKYVNDNELQGDQTKYSLALNQFIVSLKSAFNVFNLKEEEQLCSLILYALSVLTANVAAGGEFLDYSCPYVFEKILENANGHSIIYGALTMLKSYEIVFNKKQPKLLDVPDYLDRAQSLAQIFGADEKIFLNGLKNQIDVLEKFTDRDLQGLESTITVDEKTIFSSGEKMLNTFFALGGNGALDKQAVISAVNKSGDMPKHVGGMSLVRESGLGEMLASLGEK